MKEVNNKEDEGCTTSTFVSVWIGLGQEAATKTGGIGLDTTDDNTLCR